MTKCKKVAIVGTQGVPAHYGGFETFVDNLIEHNDVNDIEYTIYCSNIDLSTHFEEYKGAHLKYLSLHSNGMQSIIYDFISMLKAIRRNETILVLGISGCLFVPLIKMLGHTKILINIDGLEHQRQKWNGFASWYLRLSEKMAVYSADTIIVDNKGIQDYVTKTYQKPSELIAYGGDHVLMDIEEDIQKKELNKLGLCKGEYAITVCRIEPENNVDMILDAFAETGDKIVIVGNFEQNTYSQGLVERHRNHSNILLLNSVYDKTLLYILRNNAKYHVHGHSAGGTNPSLVEAMFFGHSIIAYDVVYNRETTNNCAKYFTSKEELISLTKEINDSDGAKLRAIASDKYLWKNISKQYEKLY